jgi:MFS family permease
MFASLAIGLLPGYATIGILAPILLVLLRCVQGFSVGGESGAAIVLTLEHSPPRRRVLLNATVNIGIPLGQILITLTLLIIRGTVGEAAFLSWAWRIPFLLGCAVAVVGVLIRRRIEESPIFRRAATTVAEQRQAPIAVVVRRYPRLLALVTLSNVPYIAMYFICSVYALSYLKGLGLPSTVGFSVLLVANIASVFIYFPTGALADRYGRKPILYVVGLIALAGVLLYFPLLNTRSWPLILLATMLTLGAANARGGASTVLMAESFPTPSATPATTSFTPCPSSSAA